MVLRMATHTFLRVWQLTHFGNIWYKMNHNLPHIPKVCHATLCNSFMYYHMMHSLTNNSIANNSLAKNNKWWINYYGNKHNINLHKNPQKLLSQHFDDPPTKMFVFKKFLPDLIKSLRHSDFPWLVNNFTLPLIKWKIFWKICKFFSVSGTGWD